MPRWTEAELRGVVAKSDSLGDVLAHFDLRSAGGNFRLLRGYLDRWEVSIEHFTHGAKRRRPNHPPRPLSDYLHAGSTIKRDRLKARLYDEGLKHRRCELCAQGEDWNGSHMSLILDHVNGVHDDNRLENLRIVCPNCNATLPTHCGKNRPSVRPPRPCARCEQLFKPAAAAQRYCSRGCWQRSRLGPRPDSRKVERPPYEQLMGEIATSSWSAVGRKYGVSCNAVRKWVQAYQWQAAEAEPRAGGPAGAVGRAAEGGEGARRDAA